MGMQQYLYPVPVSCCRAKRAAASIDVLSCGRVFAAKPSAASYHHCTEQAGVMGGLTSLGSSVMPWQRCKLFTQLEAAIEQLELN